MKKKNWVYSGTKENDISDREKKHGELAKKLATEAIVLLRNEGVMPLENKSIALFGSGADKTVKVGIGSVDVNNREQISIYRGLKEAGVSITSEDWIQDFDKRYNEAREFWKEKVLEDTKHFDNPFDAYASNPFAMPEGRAVTKDDIYGASIAIYVISRISGEGKDRRKIEGDYYLSREERENLLFLNQEQIPIILMINAGGPVEITDILEQTSQIKGILNLSQLGQEGGYAVAEILFGNENPSGRLTTTWTKHYEDIPFAESFGYLNRDLEKEDYKEDIFVGYRYFDTFKVSTLFPFGYGLSYTDFDTTFQNLCLSAKGLNFTVTVENVGNQFAGKEVVQLYLELPQDGMNREHHRLIGFAKTDCLKPQEKQTVTISVEPKQLASYFEKNHEWVIEKGTYGLCIGKHVESLDVVATLKISERLSIENTIVFQNPCAEFEDKLMIHTGNQNYVETYETTNVPNFVFEAKRATKNIPTTYLAKKQSVQDLIPLFYGNITQGASTLGSAGIRVPGSAGETTEALKDKYGKRSLIMADGPAGLRLCQNYEVDQISGTIYESGALGAVENGCLDPVVKHANADTYYQYCTAFPVGTAVAQTWNVSLVEAFGQAIATEMEEFHVDLWLAPGINIHRNPLCGRNFEYYSEDPLIAGSIAAAVTQGVQHDKRCGVTIKHFACNNQEDHRMGVNVCVSERALREIYFRGFEIAVKKSAPIALMTSYNRINGVYAANNYDLCTTVARKEWEFEGIMMSDWNTTVPEDGSIPWKCIAAGNDIIMPGNLNDDLNIRVAWETGLLDEMKVRECAGRILKVIDLFN